MNPTNTLCGQNPELMDVKVGDTYSYHCTLKIETSRWCGEIQQYGMANAWANNSHSAVQETLHLLWNQKVHYSVDKSLPLYTALSHFKQDHILYIVF